MRAAIAAPVLALLASCTTVREQPIVGEVPPASEKKDGAARSAVPGGSMAAVPRDVIDDSRCPHAARCVHAWRLVVSTGIDGPGWRETVR